MNATGGMAERFKAAVLKTVDREVRGFESLSLRQPPYGAEAVHRSFRHNTANEGGRLASQPSMRRLPAEVHYGIPDQGGLIKTAGASRLR